METTQKDLELIRLHADSVEDITKITVRQTDGSEMDFLCNGIAMSYEWKAAVDHIEADTRLIKFLTKKIALLEFNLQNRQNEYEVETAELQNENKALKARIKGMKDYTDVLRSQNYEQDYEIARLRDEINRLESEK